MFNFSCDHEVFNTLWLVRYPYFTSSDLFVLDSPSNLAFRNKLPEIRKKCWEICCLF